MNKTLFLDTNIYLHYKDIDAIDWKSLAHADQVLIVIPPIAVQELNKQKDTHSKPRVRARAAKAIDKLSDLFSESGRAQIRPDVHVLLEDRHPNIDFAAFQLVREAQDDHFIASMIMYKQENPETDVELVTSDSGLILLQKVRRHEVGIGAWRLPNDLKLPDEPDPVQQEVEKLRRQVIDMQSRLPKLSLKFKSGADRVNVTVPAIRPFDPDYVRQKVEEAKLANPKITPRASTSNSAMSPLEALSQSMLGIGSPIPQAEVDIYNAELDRYYEACIPYFEEEWKFNSLKARVVRLNISLFNDGTAPAQDMDVSMHFPDGFELLNDDNVDQFLIEPQHPVLPTKPMNQLRKFMNTYSAVSPDISSFIVPSPIQKSYPTEPPNVSSPVIKRGNSFTVEFHVAAVKHHTDEALDTLYLFFKETDVPRSFQIDYTLLSASLPNKSPGKLHVIVDDRKE